MKKQFLMALVALATQAGAQQVWRCGNAYQQQPCTGGAQVDVTDKTTPRDAANARASMQSDLKVAAALEKSRLDAQKNAAKALVIGGTPQPQPQPAASAPKHHEAKKKHKAEPEHFTAVAPKAK